MTVRLLDIEVKDFRSFFGPHRLEFGPGLLNLVGLNAETGGSNGAGKTNLIQAILWALGLCELPSAQLVPRGTELKPSVTLRLAKGDEVATIIKGHGAAFSVGDVQVKGAKASSQALATWLGSPSLLQFVYRPQQTPGRFLSLDPSARQKLLTEAQGPEFTAMRKAVETTTKAGNAAEKELAAVRASISAVTAAVQAIQTDEALVAQAKALETETRAAAAVAAAAELKVSRLSGFVAAHAPDREKKHSEAHAALSTARDTQDEELRRVAKEEAALKTWEAHRRELSAQLAACEGALGHASEALREFRAQACGHCGQPWAVQGNEAVLMEVERTAAAAVEEAEAKLKGADGQKPAVTPVSAAANAAVAECREKFEAAQTALAGILSARRDLGALEKAAATARATRDALQAKKAAVDAALAANDARQAQRQALLDQALGYGAQEKALAEKVAQAQDFAFVFGSKGLEAWAAEELLSTIQARANDILAQVPVAAPMSVVFSAQKTLADGQTRTGATWTLSYGGEPVTIEGVSGAQRQALYLATDLAWISVLRDRRLVEVDFLLLDEALDGCDLGTKEALIEAVRAQAGGATVVLVDHLLGLGGLADKTVTVRYKSGKSIFTEE